MILARRSATSPFAGSTTRYLPFGGYRTSPSQSVTDRGYTGHRHNDDLGLIYMNARYYLPGIGRFVSADTLVPNPADPQSFNRYSYGLNNPLRYTDPTGHYVVNTNDGEVDPDDIVDAYYESGDDTPLILPRVLRTEIIGYDYWMPEGSVQSTISEDSTRYKFGRFLAATGIGIDIVELILSAVPGAGLMPSGADVLVTYTAGAFTGDNYSPLWAADPPQGLPQMWISANQDFGVNLLEAFIPPAAAVVTGSSGFIAGAATPIPGDELIYGGLGLMSYTIIDATTSAISAFYDYGRYTGEFQNHYTLGFAPRSGVVLVHWR